MKYALILLSVTIGSSILIGRLAANFVDDSLKTRQERYCEQLGKTWHPDCKIE